MTDGHAKDEGLTLSLRQIETLHAVLSLRSLTAAAKMLKVSQPSISRTVKRIEDVLRLRLFDRVGKRLVPTQEALLVFEEIDAIMGQLSGLGSQISRIVSSNDGVFRLGATASVARSVVPQAIHQLSQRYPGLDLYFDVLSTDQMVPYLLNGTGDCLVTIAPEEHPALVTRKLGEGSLVAIVHRENPLAKYERLTREDLVGSQIISFQPGGPHHRAIHAWLGGLEGIGQPRVVVRFTDTAIALASQGMGAALIDSFSAMGPLGSDVAVIPLEAAEPFDVFLQWSRHRPVSRNLGRLAEEIGTVLSRIHNLKA